jgi:hypothetical protein
MHMVTDVSMDYLVTFVPPISFSNHFVNIRHVRNLEIGVILYCQHHTQYIETRWTYLIGERGGSGLLELFLVLGNESLVDLDLWGSEGGSGDKLEALVTACQL